MAVLYEFANVFVKVEKIIGAVSRGSTSIILPDEFSVGCWHDGYIARFGAMNSFDMELLKCQLRDTGLRSGYDFGDNNLDWIDYAPEGFPEGCVASKVGLDAPLVGPHNFPAFLRGELKCLQPRATALVFRDECVLLTKSRDQKKFSLPGAVVKKGESALATAIRSVWELTGLRASSGARCSGLDHEARNNRHIVSEIEVHEASLVTSRKNGNFLWWDRSTPLDRFNHVDAILKLSGVR
jgi:8-oxo-dGTP pyrophosphatase MutT (NUDIX family)